MVVSIHDGVGGVAEDGGRRQMSQYDVADGGGDVSNDVIHDCGWSSAPVRVRWDEALDPSIASEGEKGIADRGLRRGFQSFD